MLDVSRASASNAPLLLDDVGFDINYTVIPTIFAFTHIGIANYRSGGLSKYVLYMAMKDENIVVKSDKKELCPICSGNLSNIGQRLYDEHLFRKNWPELSK